MENLRYPIKLNMENTGSLLTSIRLKQGDSAITFVLRIFKNGQNVFSVDDIPSIVFNRPDGSAVIGECSVAEGQYTYKILGNELQYPGQIRADVKFDIYTETESSTTFLFECVKDTLPQNIHGAGIYVNSLKDIKDYLDQTVIKLEQELAAFDLQQVLDAVNYVQESADEIEGLMPEIRGVTGDVSNLKETVGNNDISKVGEDVTQSIINLYNSNNLYATCTTSRDQVAKEVELEDFKLITGIKIAVRFTDAGATNPTSGNITLNVNNTGAIQVVDAKSNNSVQTYAHGSNYYNNMVQEFIYDGTYWVWTNRDSDTTYTNPALGQGYATCTTAESTTAKVGVLSSYNLVTGGVVVVKFTNAVPASATLNINSKGAKPIYYKGAAITAGIIKAGDMVTFMYNGTAYMLISIDRWQSDLEQLNSNLIKVATSLQNITVNSNSEREYTFDFSNIHINEIILQVPVVYSNGLGISVGRNISKNYTVKLWNNTSSNRDVAISYYLLYK